MNNNIFTLNTINKIQVKNINNKFDIRAEIIISVLYSISVTLSKSFESFLTALILPLILLFFLENSGLKTLFKINLLNLIMIFTMLFTFPDIKYALRMSLFMTLRLNYICVIFIKLFEIMRKNGIYYLPFRFIPEKFQVLMILTIRGIFIIYERLQSALLSVKLRAANLKGISKWKVFAYVIASSLLKSSVKSEKIFLAVKCRGGFQGFIQSKNLNWKFIDNIFCFIALIYISVIILLS